MPGWHEATLKLQESGELEMVGIILEQHPERARLFMQWQRMSWPVLVDPLNLMGLAVVPVTLLIDEEGIVRFRGDLENLDQFLRTEPGGPARTPPEVSRPSLDVLAGEASTPEGLRRYADALFLWGGPARIDLAIDTYRRALAREPDHGPTLFRLGVAYRQRYDSERRRQDDFHAAVASWGKALAIDPNQYIWRRRIQQYGPRLMKPYPFYDWVDEARADIAARGETAAALPVEPRGAEIAHPSQSFTGATDHSAPDPQGKIRRDDKGFVRTEVTVVPTLIEPGAAGRVHLVLRPNPEIEAHWNNEAEDLAVWIDPPPGWQVDQRLLSVANPPELVSDEDRRLEFEIKSPKDFAGTARLSGYALYYVCEDVRGACLYRRQDIALDIAVAPRS